MDHRTVKFPYLMTFLLLFLFSMSFVFADGTPDLSFNIVHLIDLNPEYYFIFKNSSAEAVSSVVVEEGEVNENFVSLYLQHNSNILIKVLTITATDLETEDKSATYPYTMIITNAQGNTIAWIPNEDGHGSGYAHIISKTSVFRYKDTHGEVKLADFSIDLTSQDEIEFGEYSGTITLYYIVL